MSNVFCVRRSDPEELRISIPDRGTDVLISVLALACAALAETESQKRLAVWLAEHDRRLGTGFIGFAIAEMPWEACSFAADRDFLVRAVDAASMQTGWDRLPYLPNEPQLRPILGWFHKQLLRLNIADIDPYALNDWLDDMEPDDPVQTGFPRCERHGIYKTFLGCQICNCQGV